MTTSAFSATPSAIGTKRPFRPFFVAMAIFACVIVGTAFVPEYVENAAGRFPIASVLHIHGAIMAAWLGSFLLQAFLGATGRIAQHRRVGNLAFAVAWLAWASMIFVEWRALIVKPLPESPREFDWLLPGPYVYLLFPLFLAWGYRNRARPEWHKRLLTFALFLSLQAAIERYLWLPIRFGFWPFAGVLDACLLVPLVGYDLRRLKGRLHPATIQAGAVLFIAQAVLFALWGTAPWRHFAAGVVHALRRITT